MPPPPPFPSYPTKEKCAVFGVFSPGMHASQLTYFGLYALQHRGQEGSGIVSADGKQMLSHRGSGLVAQVYSPGDITSLTGHLAIGHNRYSTSKGGSAQHLQPVIGPDHLVAVAHNGNLPSTVALESFLTGHGIATRNHNDSELIALAIKYYLVQGYAVEEAVRQAYPLFTGAFSLLVMTADTLVALRDCRGIRPLCLGQLEKDGYVFSSESCGLDAVQARFIREIKPGELAVVDHNGFRSTQLSTSSPKLDVFEFIYFARPDSYLLEKSVYAVREELGRELAREVSVPADIIVPIPDSAVPAALGYAEQSGLPFALGLTKNRYIGRTFIQPEQYLREWSVQMKLNPVREVLKGKRVAILDDSIVRGTTSPTVIRLLREAGAKEVHFLVSSPPYRFPDFYGIDTPVQKQLLAFNYTEEEISRFLGADSLHYLSYPGLIRATGLKERQLTTSCFNGIYPIDILERRAEVQTPQFNRLPETVESGELETSPVLA